MWAPFKDIIMRLTNIRKKVNGLKLKISKLEYEIIEYQEICEHSDVKIKHYGSTGNYDPSADCYWEEHKCNVCDKRWTIDK